MSPGFFEPSVFYQRFDFVGAIEEAMARLPHETEIFPRIAFQNQREMNRVIRAAFEIAGS
jgi:hypothetical protein